MMPPCHTRASAGFAFTEVLVAMVLLLVICGAVFSLAGSDVLLARAQPESADMQQRARVAAETLARDLAQAGAGLTSGEAAGSLAAFLPPVVPRRLGLTGRDATGVARADAITVLWSDSGGTHATLSAALGPPAPTLAVAVEPGCPIGDPLCGLRPGVNVLVFDRQARFDVFRVSRLSGATAEVAPHAPDAPAAYAAGAHALPVATRIYYLDAAARQLRVNDGYQSDAPVVDHVVGLTFEYYGDPRPPAVPVPAPGTANCLYDATGARMGGEVLTPEGGSLATLPLGMLSDGPWCGEGLNRFDADLLRIRRVRVVLAVQAASASLRGTGPGFAVPGTARRADQTLSDFVVRFDVTPENLQVIR